MPFRGLSTTIKSSGEPFLPHGSREPSWAWEPVGQSLPLPLPLPCDSSTHSFSWAPSQQVRLSPALSGCHTQQSLSEPVGQGDLHSHPCPVPSFPNTHAPLGLGGRKCDQAQALALLPTD